MVGLVASEGEVLVEVPEAPAWLASFPDRTYQTARTTATTTTRMQTDTRTTKRPRIHHYILWILEAGFKARLFLRLCFAELVKEVED